MRIQGDKQQDVTKENSTLHCRGGKKPSLTNCDYGFHRRESTLHSIDPVHDATGQSQLGTVILKIYEQHCPFNLGSKLQGTWNKRGTMCQHKQT
jgi:hypothetical protein